VSEYFQHPGAQDADDGLFRPDRLDRSVISVPLLQQLAELGDDDPVSVVFDLNLGYPSGRHPPGWTRPASGSSSCSTGCTPSSRTCRSG